MTSAPHLDTTRRGYDEWAQAYRDHVAEVFDGEILDRAVIDAFAELVRRSGCGTAVVDVGCGPGHVTGLLSGAGLDARGVDLSPAMVGLARRALPELVFEVGSVLQLDLPDGAVAGVLAHYSLIHLPPADVPRAVAECARVLAAGGYVLVSFQTHDEPAVATVPFDHRVAPAHRWSIDALALELARAGLVEVSRMRESADDRHRFPAGHVLARKPGGPAPAAP
ncbi:class I SAM-dependent methyltransferase [Nakamurella endophytica]|uniref:Methyltransferase n=1 Tax=Nakamurella endophytica TaxID=1748367 RepID=A0A917T9U1_9ACTN|nr:class I SAM-dependent methyltransferase [Nakamurella endophytica]GGM14760.1 methyltransferase [Nakamurella endophytica]